MFVYYISFILNNVLYVIHTKGENMSTEDFWTRVNKLEELAGKANSGPWINDEKGRIDSHDHEAFSYIAQGCVKENAEYIAAANPAMIKEMVVEMRRLNKEADWLASYIGKHECVNGEPEVTICPSEESCRIHWRETAREALEK